MAKEKKKKKEGLNLDIRLNSFGEVVSSISIEELNAFLNDNVEDKKLKGKREKEAVAIDMVQ